ncbi:hypothetical protein LJB62_18965 [Bacillus sp. DFI.2.34]|nr:hypothetical protein [Bacillus sp. DFI.2.34]
MDKKLERILDILDKLNSYINVVTKEDLAEQYKNLEDFRILTDFRKKSPILKECAGRSPMSRWEMNFGWL